MKQATIQSDLLTPDCARCIGLCCVALAFDRSALFAYDKPAGEVCTNLDASHRCRIHERLEETGFRGCVQFDCLGAGQRATALFDEPRHDGAMFEAFSRMRQIHELLQLLDRAGGLALSRSQRQQCEILQEHLARDRTLAQVRELDLKLVRQDVMDFLQSLQSLLAAR